MPIPSGLTNGRGCYDSLRRCDDDTGLYSSIRHQGTSFIIDQRRAKEKQRREELARSNPLDSQVKERFSAGGLSALRSLVKYLFLVLIFPFHFCFFGLPKIIANKVLSPVLAFIEKIINKILPPIKKAVAIVYNPIKKVIIKIVDVCIVIIEKIKAPCLAALRSLGIIFSKIHAILIVPVAKVLRIIKSIAQSVSSRFKVMKIWTKLLFQDGFQYIRSLQQFDKKSK